MARYKIATVMTSGRMAWWSEFRNGTRGFGYDREYRLEFASRDDAVAELATIPRDDVTEPFLVPVDGA